MNDDELSRLRDDVRYLKDRTAIMDIMARHAHGHDRHDVDLLTSTYHIDGVDEHGEEFAPELGCLLLVAWNDVAGEMGGDELGQRRALHRRVMAGEDRITADGDFQRLLGQRIEHARHGAPSFCLRRK